MTPIQKKKNWGKWVVPKNFIHILKKLWQINEKCNNKSKKLEKIISQEQQLKTIFFGL